MQMRIMLIFRGKFLKFCMRSADKEGEAFLDDAKIGHESSLTAAHFQHIAMASQMNVAKNGTKPWIKRSICMYCAPVTCSQLLVVVASEASTFVKEWSADMWNRRSE